MYPLDESLQSVEKFLAINLRMGVAGLAGRLKVRKIHEFNNGLLL